MRATPRKRRPEDGLTPQQGSRATSARRYDSPRAISLPTPDIELPSPGIALPTPGMALPAPSLGYRLGLRDVTEEYPTPVPLAVAGEMPAHLDVTLFGNGPGRFTGANHWVDAPGYVTALRISGGEVSFQGRHIVTPEVAAEARAGQPLYGTYGDPLPHGLWTVLRRRWYRSVANTSIMFHGGKLLALADGGPPLQIDPGTLASGAPDRLGVLGPLEPLSAHPKVHRQTGTSYNFGVSYHMGIGRGLGSTLRLYGWRAGAEQPELAYAGRLPYAAVVHDAVLLTATRAVLLVPPTSLPSWPLGWITGRSSLSESIAYRPSLKTQVGALNLADAATGKAQITWGEADPMVLQHTVNAWDDGDGITMDVCDAGDFGRWTMWSHLLRGDVPQRELPGLRRLHMDAGGLVTSRPLAAVQMEFPMVSPRYVGAEHRYIWGLTWRDKNEPMFGVPARLDTHTGQVQHVRLGAGCYAGECLLVDKPDAQHEADVLLLTVVLDTVRSESALMVYDGADLRRRPLARAPLPTTLPFRFHGTLVDNAALRAATPAA